MLVDQVILSRVADGLGWLACGSLARSLLGSCVTVRFSWLQLRFTMCVVALDPERALLLTLPKPA